VSDRPALIGRTIAGRFRVTGFIGDGAMATVYRGVQDAEPRDVAIKVMQPHLVADKTFVGRFRREARAAARLIHPNTARILQYGIDGDVLFIVMELLAGQDLFELLVLERRLTEARAANIVAEVCDALAVAHDAGIVHRDLKPENVMLVRDESDPGIERVKVLDFGIAKILDSDPDAPPNSLASSVVTRVGVVVGTPAYMSPEQCRGEGIDARSDLYGCGVMLFQLVTGRLPFLGDRPFDFAIKHMSEPPPRPSTLLPSIHPGLEAIIMKALEKPADNRQQSARELAAQLRALLPELAGDLRSMRGVPRPATRASSTSPTLEFLRKEAAPPPPADDPKRLPSLDAGELDQAVTLTSAGNQTSPPARPSKDVEPPAPEPLVAVVEATTSPSRAGRSPLAWLLLSLTLTLLFSAAVTAAVLAR
jgi:serine/threonine-protein kinase